MKNEAAVHGEQTGAVDEILAEYLLAAERGEEPSRQELLERYPHVAQELEAFFARRDRFQRLAAPLCNLGTEPEEDTADPQSTTSHRPEKGTGPLTSQVLPHCFRTLLESVRYENGCSV